MDTLLKDREYPPQKCAQQVNVAAEPWVNSASSPQALRTESMPSATAWCALSHRRSLPKSLFVLVVLEIEPLFQRTSPAISKDLQHALQIVCR
jgi:hypothetical protein